MMRRLNLMMQVLLLAGFLVLTGCTSTGYKTDPSVTCEDCSGSPAEPGQTFVVEVAWSGTSFRTGPFTFADNTNSHSDPFALTMSCGEVDCEVEVGEGLNEEWVVIKAGETLRVLRFNEQFAYERRLQVRPLSGGTLAMTFLMVNGRTGEVASESIQPIPVRDLDLQVMTECMSGCALEHVAVGTALSFQAQWQHVVKVPSSDGIETVGEQRYQVDVDCGAIQCLVESRTGSQDSLLSSPSFEAVGWSSFQVSTLEPGVLTLSIRLENLDTGEVLELAPIEQTHHVIDRLELSCVAGDLCGLEPIDDNFVGAQLVAVGFAGEQPVFVMPEIFESRVLPVTADGWDDRGCFEQEVIIDEVDEPVILCSRYRFIDEDDTGAEVRVEHEGLRAQLDLPLP